MKNISIPSQEGTAEALTETLRRYYGYLSFRPGQLEVIQSILAGHDTLLIQPTGGGKSLCYQLPSLYFEGITVVVSPLISLMEDQVREAKLIGRKDITALHGGQSKAQRSWILRNLPRFQVLLMSPEGLQSEQVLQLLRKRKVSCFVVDEAHCISQWGHDFRLDYLKLKEIRKELGQPVCLALTATATKEVKQDIVRFLQLQDVRLLEYPVDRPKIKLHVEKVATEQDKLDWILKLTQARQDAGMIYCATRSKTEELTERLLEAGISGVAYYHGGLSAEDRFIIQQQFLEGELKLICATNAFGMGVNKPNIRYVIHYHFPSHLEAYVQEMGRCSRDGREGLSLVLAQAGDEQLPFHFLEAEYLTFEQLQMLFSLLQAHQEKGMTWRKEELLSSLLCSEQALDVALHHWQNIQQAHPRVSPRSLEEGIEEVYRLLQEQKLRKRKKIGRILQWLELDKGACRRKEILRYFGQELSEAVPKCCDLCDAKQAGSLGQMDAEAYNAGGLRKLYQELYLDIDEHISPKESSELTSGEWIEVRQQPSAFERELHRNQVLNWQDKLNRLWPIN